MDELLKIPHYERTKLHIHELGLITTTGTHPVFFAENQDGYLWGKGTLFLALWGGHQFAIAAKHVITNQNANYKHLRILIRGNEAAIPIQGVSIPSFPNHECKNEVEDIFIFQIPDVPNFDDCKAEWNTWKMESFWMPASSLQVGQDIYAVGYPFNEDRFDYENNKLNFAPMISVGKLSNTSLGKGIFTIDCADFEIELNGMSGGPVFARFDGLFHYVGMIIRGTKESRKIHFIDSEFVTFTLNKVSKDWRQE